MKNASFSALLYREYVICKKSLRTGLIFSLLMSLFPGLIGLSIRFGNLALVPENILGQFLGEGCLPLKLSAAVAPCMLCMALVDASSLEVQPNWNRFRRSTPVKPARMALAKYAFLGILLVASFLMALVCTGICAAILNTGLTKTDLAVIVAILTVFTALIVACQVSIMLLGSVDKGMVALLALMVAGVFLLPERWKADFNVQWLLGFAEVLLPWSVPVLGAVLALGWGLTAWIYRRRER